MNQEVAGQEVAGQEAEKPFAGLDKQVAKLLYTVHDQHRRISLLELEKDAATCRAGHYSFELDKAKTVIEKLRDQLRWTPRYDHEVRKYQAASVPAEDPLVATAAQFEALATRLAVSQKMHANALADVGELQRIRAELTDEVERRGGLIKAQADSNAGREAGLAAGLDRLKGLVGTHAAEIGRLEADRARLIGLNMDLNQKLKTLRQVVTKVRNEVSVFFGTGADIQENE